MSAKVRPFFKVLPDGQRHAEQLAAATNLSPLHIKGALNQMWEYAWKREDDVVSAIVLGGLLQDHHYRLEPLQFEHLLTAMQAFGFLEVLGADSYRIKGAAELHGFAARHAKREASAANGQKGGRPKKEPRETQEKPTKNPAVTQKEPTGNLEAQEQANVGDFGNPEETHRNLLLGSKSLGSTKAVDLLAPAAKELFSQGGEGLAAEPAAPAQPAESEAKGDHVAREAQPAVEGMRRMAELVDKADFLRRFVGAFRANTPPEPPSPASPSISANGASLHPPETQDSGQQASSPVSQARPPDRPSAISPYEPAAPAVPPPLEKIGEGHGKGYPVLALQAHIGEMYEATFGHSYFWHPFEVKILGEMLGVFSPVDILDRWRADVHELREVKALKRAMMRTNGHAQRFNPNQGIMVAS